MDRQFNDKSPVVNQSLFNPDWIYGMMNPKAPWVNRNLIWHMYSGQAYGTSPSHILHPYHSSITQAKQLIPRSLLPHRQASSTAI